MPILKNYYADDERNIAEIAQLKKRRALDLAEFDIQKKKKEKRALLKKQMHEKYIEQLRLRMIERKKKKQKRVLKILQLQKQGYNMQGIAIKIGLSRERVRQIVDEDFTDEQQNEFYPCLK